MTDEQESHLAGLRCAQRHRFAWAILLVGRVLCGQVFGGTLPLVHDVDVLVVGGSGAAVEAALAAAESGASVFLAAPRTYLGDDSAGRLRLWLEPDETPATSLAKLIYGESRPVGLPFTYTYGTAPAVGSADELSPDPDNSKLGDGIWNDKTRAGVRCYGLVQTNRIDLGTPQTLTHLTVHAFARSAGSSYCIFKMSVEASDDGASWSPVGNYSKSPAINTSTEQPGDYTDTFRYDYALNCTARFLRLIASPNAAVMNIWWGEIVVQGAQPLSPKPYAARSTTAPLNIKKSQESALIDAGVRLVTGTYATEALLDGEGQPSGAVLLNRSGRFAVRAKCVIDASDSARVTRHAGATLRPFAAGTYPLTQVVIAGQAPVGEGLSVRALTNRVIANVTGVAAPAGMPSVITGQTYICTLDLPLADASSATLAAAQQTLRDATFAPTQLDCGEQPIWTTSESIVGLATSTEPSPSPQALPLDVLRPAARANLLVLSMLADVSRAAATHIFGKPVNAMTLGRRAGFEAAANAAARQAVGPVHVAPGLPPGVPPRIFREPAGRWLPATRSATGEVADAAAELPASGTCDVLVIGGGTAGSPAAIAAGRAGRSVIVCEYQHALGGVQTVGLLGSYYHGNSCGFTLEIDAGTAATGAVLAQSKAEWYRRQIRTSGGVIRFGTMGCGVLMEGSRVVGAIVAGPDGVRTVIRASVVIDSTGNADLAAAAGAPTEFINAAELSLQGATLNYRPLGKSVVNIDIGFVDDTDGFDLFFFPLRARQTWGAAQYWDQSQMVDSRERRRIVGDLYLQPLDFMNKRTFPDTIVQCKATHDTHGQATHDLLMMSTISGSKSEYEANLPYRALLPRNVDGLLVTGLGISAHRDAIAVMRMQRDVQNQGYAAGYAAALAVGSGVTPREISVPALKQHLADKGILEAKVLTYADNFPLTDSVFNSAVATVPLYGGYGGVWVLMTDTNRAVAKLRTALQSATDPLARARYGTVLAMFGDASGAADIHALLAAASAWDTGGWNFTSMPAFGRKLSHFDTYVIALGRLRYGPALPDILRLTALLDQDAAYSHFRAVALACEAYGDASAIPVLSAIMEKTGLRGNALVYGTPFPVYSSYSGAAGDAERTRCLREICMARALYRIGDDAGKNGEAMLTAYANDPRSAYAAHATLVLAGDAVLAPAVTATAGDGQIALAWSLTFGATNYTVRQAVTAGGPYVTLVAGLATNGYVHTGLVNGSTNYYVVAACTTAGDLASAEVSAVAGAAEGDGGDEGDEDEEAIAGHFFVAKTGSDAAAGTTWATAFLTIGQALSVATNAGDIVTVSNGIYAISSPITLAKAVTLISVNGYADTTIQASNCRGVTISAAGATLAGFTVRGGNSNYGKGANIYLSAGGLVSNCLSTACVAWQWATGGGIAADAGTISHCVIRGNLIDNRSGAGVWLGGMAILSCSVIVGNTNRVNNASYRGGGVYAEGDSTIRNCTIIGNSAVLAGGIYLAGNARVANTILADNTVYGGTTLNNILAGNGANVSHCCTFPTNGLTGIGNTDLSPNLNRQNGLFPPQLGSACIDSGMNADWMTGTTDIAGANRVIHGTVDIGACEYVTPDVLTCGFTASPIAGIDALNVTLTAAVAGPGQTGLVYFWDFENDGTYDVSGSGYDTVVHHYAGGIHSIRLRVVNDQSVEAESLQVNAVTVAAATTHVVTNNAGAAYPYATWATAATRVQDAAGAVVDNGTVWVSNGVYKLAATLVIAKPITVRSVNGWTQTTLSGNNSVRTVNLQSSGAVIDGFTIRDGSLAYGLGQNLYLQPGTAKNCRITACKVNSAQGGGVCADGGHLVNCIIDGNTVNGQGPAGVDLRNASTMVNCLVTGNRRTAGSSFWGGGVRAQSASAAIRNCTITDNWEYDATKGAGLHLDQAATVVNGIIARNGKQGAPADFSNNLLGNTNNVSYTCIWPPAFNYATLTKMVTADPRFMDPAGGNFHLNKLSPCRNQGLHQPWMVGAVDLDGAARVDHKEAVDLGAYETPFRTSGTLMLR